MSSFKKKKFSSWNHGLYFPMPNQKVEVGMLQNTHLHSQEKSFTFVGLAYQEGKDIVVFRFHYRV